MSEYINHYIASNIVILVFFAILILGYFVSLYFKKSRSNLKAASIGAAFNFLVLLTMALVLAFPFESKDSIIAFFWPFLYLIFGFPLITAFYNLLLKFRK